MYSIAMRNTEVELEALNLIKFGLKKYIDKNGEPVIHLVNECPKWVQS